MWSFPIPFTPRLWAGNAEYSTRTLRFTYTSLVVPNSVFDYDMETRERELKKQQEVVGGYDASQYVTERIFAQAPDGVSVPISLVYRKGLARDGNAPMLLYGYGAYGLSSDPRFSSDRLSLLDRGLVLRHRPRARRRRPGQALARSRTAADQEEIVHRFHCLRRTSDPGKIYLAPIGSRSKAAAPEDC